MDSPTLLSSRPAPGRPSSRAGARRPALPSTERDDELVAVDKDADLRAEDEPRQCTNSAGRDTAPRHALHAPVNSLHANWAYMVMAALAWSLKAWIALLVPVSPRWATQHLEQRRRLLTIDFRTFVAAIIHIPCQIIRAARRILGSP